MYLFIKIERADNNAPVFNKLKVISTDLTHGRLRRRLQRTARPFDKLYSPQNNVTTYTTYPFRIAVWLILENTIIKMTKRVRTGRNARTR